jgi:2-methylcitrate dehydratase PrpD
MTVLEQIGEWVAATRPVPEPVRDRLGIHVLDTVGAWVAGRATEEGALLQGLATAGESGLALLGDAPLDRIAQRASTVRLSEMDDIHMPSCTTPGSVVVTTALTLAAHLPAVTAASFAQALQVGYEITTRLGTAVAGPTILYRGIWPTYLVGPIGAAAVTARLLGLDAGRTADALGLALSLSSGAAGVSAPSGASARWLQLGLAARDGAAAALAAAHGYAGDRTLLDADWLMKTHGIDCDGAGLALPLAADGAVAGLSIKPYCSAKQCIAAIDGFRQLLASGIAPDDIAAVRVAVPPAYAGMIGQRRPGPNRMARISTAAYQLALVSYRPDLLEDIARPDLTGEPAIAAFMARVEVVPDEALARYYPRQWPARIEARLRDGRTEMREVLDALGDPARPFDEAAARGKFHRLVDQSLGHAAGAALADACLRSVASDDALARLCALVGEVERAGARSG